ncbi:MAG: GTPase HflX [Acidobacteria bacterium]|nr:GTPase HflX [Acidobacteriota bacterium]
MLTPDPSQRERAILVGVVSKGQRRRDVEANLDELARLVDTAGGDEIARLVQERSAPDPATVVGEGFAEKIAGTCASLEADLVVFDDDLSGSQVRNLEALIPDDVKVMDRAGVILDIFAQRAHTREAQTQVELAQLSYLLPRLTRRWGHLSRQAGGIGTRGVGETQLEIDRRLITRRIARLQKQLATIEASRRRRRSRRWAISTIALVGYTNAGKSSLFQQLTGADVPIEDRLFATLDPRARKVALGDDLSAVLTDTVGFIRKLPHHLVAPFRSTLEEAADAEAVLHLVDISDPGWEEHLRVGTGVLEDLGVEPGNVIVAFNKIDRIGTQLGLLPSPNGKAIFPGWRGRPETARSLPGRQETVWVSALTGEGLPELRALLRRRLLTAPGVATLHIPLEDTGAVEAAMTLPGRIARRFGRSSLMIAVRTTPKSLDETGLTQYLGDGWDPAAPEPRVLKTGSRGGS